MKNLTIRIVALSAISVLAVPALAHVHTKPGPKKAAIICPVTGDKIASPQKAFAKEVFKGRTYYFCCNTCKPRFDKNPAKYVKNAAKGQFEKM